jgi:hypothetical protein
VWFRSALTLIRILLFQDNVLIFYKKPRIGENMFIRKFLNLTLFSLFIALLTGCASMGPGSIGRDRIDYDQAITQSWQRQLLLNLVKLRYGDTPFFLDVASITNSYGLETQVNMGASWWSHVIGAGASNAQTVSGSSRYTDKPTITYSPMLGQRFTRSLMTPIPPGVVVSLIQAGWAADAVLKVMVSSINGVYNRYGAGARARGADPDFYRLSAAMRRIQASGAIGMRIDRMKDQEWAVLTIETGKKTKEVEADQETVRGILGIRKDAKEYRVVFGSAPRNDEEIAMITRSLLEILIDLGAAIDVPRESVTEGRTPATKAFETDGPDGYRPLIRVQSGAQHPEDAFVAVQYRNSWFWIEDRDYASKSLFSFLLILLSLTDADPGKGSPIITIPAS